jgi:hypothetical protein
MRNGICIAPLGRSMIGKEWRMGLRGPKRKAEGICTACDQRRKARRECDERRRMAGKLNDRDSDRLDAMAKRWLNGHEGSPKV